MKLWLCKFLSLVDVNHIVGLTDASLTQFDLLSMGWYRGLAWGPTMEAVTVEVGEKVRDAIDLTAPGLGLPDEEVALLQKSARRIETVITDCKTQRLKSGRYKLLIMGQPAGFDPDSPPRQIAWGELQHIEV